MVSEVVIGRTVGLISSVGRVPDLQAWGRGFESCIGHTFTSLVYFNYLKWIRCSLTLKAPRKSASENVVCLCRLLHLLANFSNLHFAYRQTVWTQIRLIKEQSDLGPHCLQK